jgi:hypothetical protein
VAAAVGSRLQVDEGLEVLAHPAPGGHAVTKAGRDPRLGLALVIELEDSLTPHPLSSPHSLRCFVMEAV